MLSLQQPTRIICHKDVSTAQFLIGKLVVWYPSELKGKIGEKIRLYKYDRATKHSLTTWHETCSGEIVGMVVAVEHVHDLLPFSGDTSVMYGPVVAVVLCEDFYTLFWAGSLVPVDQDKNLV